MSIMVYEYPDKMIERNEYTTMEDKFITVRDFAQMFHITEDHARNIFRASKTLRAFQLGGKWVCEYSDFCNFKERIKETRDVSLCYGTKIDTIVKPQGPEMELLLLNGASYDVIMEVLYGEEEEGT